MADEEMVRALKAERDEYRALCDQAAGLLNSAGVFLVPRQENPVIHGWLTEQAGWRNRFRALALARFYAEKDEKQPVPQGTPGGEKRDKRTVKKGGRAVPE
jgi:hypothetical protein